MYCGPAAQTERCLLVPVVVAALPSPGAPAPVLRPASHHGLCDDPVRGLSHNLPLVEGRRGDQGKLKGLENKFKCSF